MKKSIDSSSFITPFQLKELIAWMDGGSITLYLLDGNKTEFSVEFCQKMILKEWAGTNIPGSFLLDGQEVSIRSDNEKQLLQALRGMSIGHLTSLDKSIIQESIAFVESEEYLRIATLMGRWPV
ncbi:hypothetical protein CDA63_03555 [Hymenobacter amundsenii]|uniref:Uncharacterized protein n=1 Tax=Hymenobacter amundsenii TaxID=2006685 RepID=A0A246FP50_9BACT|nr:hypothetical protein [Hymenobacter amundsenii]OWP64459.1 hypothetical protein CDA63_03555 [Hymenobacter amundsenii]